MKMAAKFGLVFFRSMEHIFFEPAMLELILAEMTVFYVAGNLKWERRKWSVIHSFPTETNSVEKTFSVAWLDEKLLLL